MAFPFYLAATAAEFSRLEELSAGRAWMACHFSGYGTGLSNLPESLPPGAMVIVNDRVPVCGHDPGRIREQLEELTELWKPGCVLLDFQRPGEPRTARIAAALAEGMGCPVGVSETYARELPCPVFLPPPPPDRGLEAWLAPWKGRELWLEAALDSCVFTVTEEGSRRECLPFAQPEGELFRDSSLHCSYRIRIEADAVRFYLYRTRDDLRALLRAGQALGVTRAVGLYQELGEFMPFPEE